jgi:hypothetical protein
MKTNDREIDDYRKRVQWRYDRSVVGDGDNTLVRRSPPKPPRILVHNFPAPENAQRIHGEGGFRVWTQLRDEAKTRCSCGWRPDLGPHFTSHTESKRRMAAIRAKAKREGYYVGPNDAPRMSDDDH